MAVRYNLFDSFFLEDKQMQDLSLPKMSCIKRNKTSGKKVMFGMIQDLFRFHFQLNIAVS